MKLATSVGLVGGRLKQLAPTQRHTTTAVSLALALAVSPPYVLGPASNLLLRIGDSQTGGGITVLDCLIGTIVVSHLLTGRLRVPELDRPVYAAVFAVLVSRCCSLIAAEHAQPAQFISVCRYLQSMVLIYVVSSIARNDHALATFLRWLTGLMIIESLGDMVMLSMEGRGIFLSLTSGRFQGLLFVTFILELLRRRVRPSQPFVAAILIIGLMASLTRLTLLVTILTLILGCLYLVKYNLVKAGRVVVATIVISAGALLMSLTAQTILASVSERSATLDPRKGDLFNNDRFYLWGKALGLFADHPFTGIGSGAFGRMSDKSHVPAPEWFPTPGPAALDANIDKLGTHSTLTNILAETGLIGLAGYLWWVTAIFRKAPVALKASRLHRHGSLLVALAAWLTTTICLDAVYVGSFENATSVMVGLLLGLLAQRRPTSLTAPRAVGSFAGPSRAVRLSSSTP